MSDDNRGYIWLRTGEWVGWTQAAPTVRPQRSFSFQDNLACKDALAAVVSEIDPKSIIVEWILIHGAQDRQETYEQWTQDPQDDFLANLQIRLPKSSDTNCYYKLIVERPDKKVEYIVSAFHVATELERIVEDVLPASSRVHWVPLGYLATTAPDLEADPIVILITATQTVALCYDRGQIRDLRTFQFSIGRCLEQLRRDHFSDNQARQFLDMEFSFLSYQDRDRILSLKIEVDQFLDDIKRLLLARIKRQDQPVYIAAEVFSHHAVEQAIQETTSNPVSLLTEQDWVYAGALKWSKMGERFLLVSRKKDKKERKKTQPISPESGRNGLLIGAIICVMVILMVCAALRHRVGEQVFEMPRQRDALIRAREDWKVKVKAVHNGAKAISKMEHLRDQVVSLKRRGALP